MLTRQHFDAMALAVREADDGTPVVREIAIALGRICAVSNVRFDVHRFMEACGFE